MSRVNLLASFGVFVVGAASVCGICPAAHAEDATMTAKLQQMVGQLNDKEQASLYLFLSELKHEGAAPAVATTPAAKPAAPATATPAAAPAATTPQQQMEAGIAKLKEAAMKDDLDGIMTIFSEKFEHPQVGGKSDMRNFIKNIIDMGYLKQYAPDTKINLKDAQYKVEGDKVTVYPVDVTGPFGSATVEIVAKQENGTWKVVSGDISGI